MLWQNEFEITCLGDWGYKNLRLCWTLDLILRTQKDHWFILYKMPLSLYVVHGRCNYLNLDWYNSSAIYYNCDNGKEISSLGISVPSYLIWAANKIVLLFLGIVYDNEFRDLNNVPSIYKDLNKCYLNFWSQIIF